MYCNPNEGYDGYRTVNLKAQTAQATPVQLVLMLVDGLLDELARLRMHIQHRRFELKARSIEKCVDILTGLGSALETDQGNEVVNNLAQLYEYSAARLNKAGFEMDPTIVDEVSTIVTTLRTGWLGVANARA
ncbi:MAG TPA: flagellar export chaperone FliS [Rhizobacter sp.]|jgi:flagellar protein FliS|nr:flagellar export chaperone FliS [Rhizobacter sp.]